MNQAKRIEILTRLREQNPHPTTELEYNSPFELLIAVILSAQATDKGVNKATAKLFPVANTPQAILDLGLEGLKEYIKTIGLYNSKAENIIKTCRDLVEKHNGEVPESREALEALAGVGRKTANVVLNTAFGHPTIAVDTHIFRVCNRTNFAPENLKSMYTTGLFYTGAILVPHENLAAVLALLKISVNTKKKQNIKQIKSNGIYYDNKQSISPNVV